VNLTAQNTAIVLDSTADFPEARERFENWRMVPLYVRFGDESFRDYVELDPDAFYARLRAAEETPTTSQPTPGDFLAVYEELEAYERILSLHIAVHAAVIGRQAMVAAGSVVTPGTIIPPRVLAAGSPAAVKKELSGAALASVERSAKVYHELSASYLRQRLNDPARQK
jgi:DegV family protein with EDD domain